MEHFLNLIGRKQPLFTADMNLHARELSDAIESSSFLVIGAAGSIGQAVSKEIFKRNPNVLHCVDLSENNLVELVRDLRSSIGYIKGEFKTFALDAGSPEFIHMVEANGPYDFILNLSALKHVRSEEDAYTLMRMIKVNILNTENSILSAIEMSSKKYFCVSTDKAANPVNMMGASKRIMELFLSVYSNQIDISTARFANVAFSDGSLLEGFNQRIKKNQPISAPNDVKRYFLTPQESGELCLLSCLLGDNGDIFFPKLDENIHLITFSEIASRYLIHHGYSPHICSSEEEARSEIKNLIKAKKWPCFFSQSSTTGEKDFEEFFEVSDTIDSNTFKDIGIIKSNLDISEQEIYFFKEQVLSMLERGCYSKESILELFQRMLPEFNHNEKGIYLDSKM
jgi:FlaA1/EpsC-like NDP-sugar epimerase